MAKAARNSARALVRLPWSRSTSPIFSWLIERSRCHFLLGQALGNAEIGAEFGEGGGEVALVVENLADLAVADRKVSLPFRVARVLLDETLSDFEIGAVFSEGGGEVALVAEHVANPLMAGKKGLLPVRVG